MGISFYIVDILDKLNILHLNLYDNNANIRACVTVLNLIGIMMQKVNHVTFIIQCSKALDFIEIQGNHFLIFHRDFEYLHE